MGIGARKKPTKKPKPKPEQPKERLRPMSLYPLEFDAAMRGILGVVNRAEGDGNGPAGTATKSQT